jgi:hypothetical protein
MLVDPWTDAPPDLRQLCRALGECGVAADQIEQTVDRLTRPPRSFGLSASRDDSEMLSRVTIQLGAGLDDDMAARLLYPGKGATWKALSNPEKKRANRLRDWFGKSHGLSTNPKGQPPKLDAALVLYCTRVLAEAIGKDRFPFGRLGGGRKLSGPAWRALIEALPIAQRFLALRYKTPIGATDESIAGIITLARSEAFASWSQKIGLGPSSHDVAASPASFRFAFMRAREERVSARELKPRQRRA